MYIAANIVLIPRFSSSSPAQLCSQMEQLERENQQLKDGAARAGAAPAGSLVDGELLRLQAENTALQKNVAGINRPLLGMREPRRLSRVFPPGGRGRASE